MIALYWLYGWLMDRPGMAVRWVVVSGLVFLSVGGGVAILLEIFQGFPDESYQAWMAFVIGFTAVAFFNIGLHLVGLGYPQWKEKQSSGSPQG